MKHKITFVASLVLLLAVFGCSFFNNSNPKPGANTNQAVLANQDLIDQAATLIFGNEKTGVPQCDEVLAKLETQMSGDSSQETLPERAKREAVRQVIFKLVRDNITETSSAADKKQIGERCRQAAAQFLTE